MLIYSGVRRPHIQCPDQVNMARSDVEHHAGNEEGLFCWQEEGRSAKMMTFCSLFIFWALTPQKEQKLREKVSAKLDFR